MLNALLLGQFELTLDGKLINLVKTPRLQSLMAYLIIHRGRILPRSQVAATFWPDELDTRARNNLRQLLHQLRRTLPDADRYLRTDANSLQWCVDSDFRLDVDQFEFAIRQVNAVCKTGNPIELQQALECAVSVYRGELLPSCHDDWIIHPREELQRLFAEALRQLVELLEQRRQTAAALPYAQRLVESDPLNEEHTATAMRLYASQGDRTSAIRVFHAHAAILQAELGIEPSQALRDACKRLSRVDVDSIILAPANAVEQTWPLIGRQMEWERLYATWQSTLRGHAHLALVSGEAGIGKSRLTEELMRWVRKQGIGVAHTRAYEAEGSLAYAPVTEWLRSDAVRPALMRLDKLWLSEVARIVPEFLTQGSGILQPAPMSDASQRQRFFEAMARAVLSVQQPLLLVVDDLQWCDKETLEWLRFLLRFDTRAKVLIVGAARSTEVDDKHPLTRLALDLRKADQLTQIELKRLDAAESSHLASHVLNRVVDIDEATQLYRDTEGNPLFVVEMARMSAGELTSGGASEHAHNRDDGLVYLPPKVHAVITSHLAQVSEAAAEVMHMGATIGRAFSFDVLVKASDANEESVLRCLDELWQRRIVRTQDVSATHYDFTHDKLREVAYAQLSPAKRRLLHRRAAQAIEEVHGVDLNPVSAQLAAHYETVGEHKKAAAFYLRAAKVARRMFADDQAISLLGRGLSLVPKTTDDPECLELEFDTLTMLSSGFGATGGSNASLQFASLERAQKLGRQLGRHLHPSILRALSTNYVIRSRLRESQQVGEQLLDLAMQSSDRVLEVEAHEALGITHFWTGAFGRSRSHLEKSIALYLAEQLNSHIDLFIWDPRIVSECRIALTLLFLGYPDQARHRQAHSLALGQAVGHPFSLAYSMGMNSFLQMMLGNADAVHKQAVSSLTMSSSHSNLDWWRRQAQIQNAWALATADTNHLTVNKFWNELDKHFSALGIKLMRPFYYTLIAHLYGKLGEFDQSLKLLADAHETTEQAEEGWYEAETHRTRGEVLLAMGRPVNAVECEYRLAIDIAKKQQAKFLELRAATSLARLWQSQNKFAEARDLLAIVYAWFIEGFDTLDLGEAKVLLDTIDHTQSRTTHS